MWCDEQASWVPGGTASAAHPSWLLLGPDRAMLDGLAQSLVRFGVTAQCDDADAMPPSSAPMLCDARNRALVHSLLDLAPPRLGALLVLGVNAPHKRAQMILSGADDAVSPRITPYELAARMAASHRARVGAQGIIRLAGFVFDTGLRQVCWQRQIVLLMPREFNLLIVLARHGGQAVSRDTLLCSVWQTAFDTGTNSPEVHIFKLRQRLAALGGAARIETVKREGYRLVSDPPPQG